jgi:hypothetical protein
MVFGVTYINDPMFGNRETIEYECRICDRSGNARCEKYLYYQKDEKHDNFIAKCNKIQSEIVEIKKTTNLLQNVCIMTSMYMVGIIVQYFRE